MHYQNFLQTHNRIQVGNGQYVSVLFVIPVIIDIQGQIRNFYFGIQNT